jgi:hypothetical protein
LLAVCVEAGQVALAQGRCAEDQVVVAGDQFRRGFVDVERLGHGVVVVAFLDHLGDAAGVAGAAAEKEADAGHGAVLEGVG